MEATLEDIRQARRGLLAIQRETGGDYLVAELVADLDALAVTVIMGGADRRKS